MIDIYLFIDLLNFATYNKQVTGSPQQCTPITMGPLKIAKFKEYNTKQHIRIQNYIAQYNNEYYTMQCNATQCKIQLPPPTIL
jgi:hypothetical protein